MFEVGLTFIKENRMGNPNIGTVTRYTPAEREKIRARIAHLNKHGFDDTKIASILNKEGYRAPDGSRTSKPFVTNQRYLMGRKNRKKKKRTYAPRGTSIKNQIREIIDAKLFNAEAKIVAIRNII